MDREISVDPELTPLLALLRELTARKIQVGLSDAIPALRVYTAFPGVQLHVYVTCSGESFTWQEAQNRHPVTDPGGAAALIAEYVRSWNARQGATR